VYSVYGDFIIIVVFHVLYIAVLGPGRIPLPKLYSLKSKFLTRDALSDTFETASAEGSVSLDIEKETTLKTIHIEISEPRVIEHVETTLGNETVEIVELETRKVSRESKVESAINDVESYEVTQVKEGEGLGVEERVEGEKSNSESEDKDPHGLEESEKSDLSVKVS